MVYDAGVRACDQKFLQLFIPRPHRKPGGKEIASGDMQHPAPMRRLRRALWLRGQDHRRHCKGGESPSRVAIRWRWMRRRRSGEPHLLSGAGCFEQWISRLMLTVDPWSKTGKRDAFGGQIAAESAAGDRPHALIEENMGFANAG